ncbi:Glycosyl transferase family 2 [Chitinophaga costaii]|uniref:Glycosyl transferase family 2 n=1 Tax=Chitinophaga costaii TaxID=1335309 RepID=A0A1C4D1R7_9BACT|nr:glycosyltransferase family 2 protein [Chitinophaga costaii]PUZ24421.1 hypothetical protein DCM91_10890 [Chitinophaga costaii]SCC25231.1 Glycosyl transferase family 2 [Chitinophaga costaii]
MKTSIDIVIPSFRLEEKYILPILQLQPPADADVKFYLVVDNPAVHPSPAIRALVDNVRVFLHINQRNQGAAITRNAGLEAGAGQWVLFLDDDILVPANLLQTYATAAITQPEEIGFIGLITFPPAQSTFTQAIDASGSMDIFRISLDREAFAWGATANIMVKRSAMGPVRFSTAYPKSGGGEDVDFFINVRQRNDYKDFRSLPLAAVEHPWWNNNRVNYQRPYRYGIGNSWLPKLNPRYAYHDMLDTPETLLVAALVTVVVSIVHPSALGVMLVAMAGIIVIEFIATSVQVWKRKGRVNVQTLYYVMMLRLAHDGGMLAGKLKRGEWWRIGQRFHYDGVINKLYFYRSNTYRTIKWILYPLLAWMVWRHF